MCSLNIKENYSNKELNKWLVTQRQYRGETEFPLLPSLIQKLQYEFKKLILLPNKEPTDNSKKAIRRS